MNKDVIRGVRWAVLMSVVAIAAIAADRWIRPLPPAIQPPTSQAPAPVAEPSSELIAVAAPVPEPVPGTLAPLRRLPNSSNTPARFDPVPPPPSLPPLTEAVDYGHPAPPTIIAVVRTQEVRASPVEQSPAAPAAVAPEPVPERVTNYSQAEAPTPASPAVRAIRSVGRVLGLGRKSK